MIEHLKLKNHKGIETAFLSGLGKINVICGKNNSGKTSILESISLEENHCLGLNVIDTSTNIIPDLTYITTQSYRDENTNLWIKNEIKSYCMENPIWYSDNFKEIITGLVTSVNRSKYHVYIIQYEYNEIIANEFSKRTQYDNYLYIPPKRQFKSIKKIDLNTNHPIEEKGVINELFFLKNQDLKSEDFRIYKEIDKAFNKITTYRFNIVPFGDNQLKLTFLIDNQWIPADDCGLGLKDILYIITHVCCTKDKVYLVEEPENHLHADFQKKLLNFFHQTKDKQFIISTHSNVFIDSHSVDKIYYCWFDKSVQISDKTSMSKILDSLGHSITENLTADAIVLTEGPTDIPIVKKTLALNNVLDAANIKFWPLGGDIMGELDLSIFAGNNVFALIDDDPGSAKVRNKFIKNCKENEIPCVRLKRYSIENYIPLSIIKNVFANQIPKEFTELKDSESVDVQIGFKAKDKSIKGKNHIMANQLEKKHLEDTDLWEFAERVKQSIEGS